MTRLTAGGWCSCNKVVHQDCGLAYIWLADAASCQMVLLVQLCAGRLCLFLPESSVLANLCCGAGLASFQWMRGQIILHKASVGLFPPEVKSCRLNENVEYTSQRSVRQTVTVTMFIHFQVISLKEYLHNKISCTEQSVTGLKGQCVELHGFLQNEHPSHQPVLQWPL